MTGATLRETKREQTHRALAQACFDLAILHGVDGFTIEEAVASVHLSRRTFFNHFVAKEEAIVAVSIDRLHDAIAGLVRVDADITIEAQLESILRAQFTTAAISTHVELRRLAVAHPSLLPYLREAEHRGMAEAAHILTKTGPRTLSLTQAFMIVGAAYGAISALLDGQLHSGVDSSSVQDAAAFDFDEFVHRITDFLRNGIDALGD